MSMKWKVERCSVSMSCIGNGGLNVANLAGSSLHNGHIGCLDVKGWSWMLEEGNPEVLKRVWEIADEMVIFNEMLKVGGGKGEDREKSWQRVLDFFSNNDSDSSD